MIVWVTVIYTLTAWLTLRAIKRQADIMDAQAKETRDSAVAAALITTETLAAINRQADQMAIQAGHMETQSRHMEQQLKDARAAHERSLVLQFRPKITVRGGYVFDEGRVAFWITNTGASKAIVTTFSMDFPIVGEGTAPLHLSDDVDQFDVPTVFQPGETKMHSAFMKAETYLFVTEQDETARKIPKATFTTNVFCMANIKYSDDVGIERMTGLLRKYNPLSGCFVPSTFSDGEFSD